MAALEKNLQIWAQGRHRGYKQHRNDWQFGYGGAAAHAPKLIEVKVAKAKEGAKALVGYMYVRKSESSGARRGESSFATQWEKLKCTYTGDGWQTVERRQHTSKTHRDKTAKAGEG